VVPRRARWSMSKPYGREATTSGWSSRYLVMFIFQKCARSGLARKYPRGSRFGVVRTHLFSASLKIGRSSTCSWRASSSSKSLSIDFSIAISANLTTVGGAGAGFSCTGSARSSQMYQRPWGQISFNVLLSMRGVRCSISGIPLSL
jgi:hypothetical protein